MAQTRPEPGASPKEALSPQAYRELVRQLDNQTLPTSGQVKAIRRQTTATTEQVRALAAQIADLTAQLKTFKEQLARDKDMSRVAVLERREDERDEADKRALANHESNMAWLRAIAVAGFSSAIGITAQLILSARRNKRREEEAGALEDHVDLVRETVDTVSKGVGSLQARVSPRLVKLPPDTVEAEGVDIGLSGE